MKPIYATAAVLLLGGGLGGQLDLIKDAPDPPPIVEAAEEYDPTAQALIDLTATVSALAASIESLTDIVSTQSEVIQDNAQAIDDQREAINAIQHKPEPETEPTQPTAAKPLLPDGWRVQMFTIPGCAPCQRMKRDVLPKFRRSFVFDGTKSAREVSRLRITRYPTTLLVRPNNKIAARWTGFVSSKSIARKAQVMSRARPAQDSSRFVRTRWGNIDLETYNRPGCNCPMCRSIRAMQAKYSRQASTDVEPGQQPSPDEKISLAVRLLGLTSSDTLADLGCGDGRALIAAVKEYGCRGVGIEIDPQRANVAREAVADAGLADSIRIMTGDARAFDLASHGVTQAYVYLFEDLLGELQEQLATVDCVSVFHEVPGLQGVQIDGVFLYRA